MLRNAGGGRGGGGSMILLHFVEWIWGWRATRIESLLDA